jgi:hypothetical protein
LALIIFGLNFYLAGKYGKKVIEIQIFLIIFTIEY